MDFGPHAPFPTMYWADANSSGMRVLVMEMFETSLSHFLKSRTPISEVDIRTIGCQLWSALTYMHSSLQVVHLDTKPGNVLINPGVRKVALTDFGMVEPIGVRNPSFDQYVTAPYRAPELFPEASVPGVLLRPSVDAWSFGCVVWELSCHRTLKDGSREFLFEGKDAKSVYRMIREYVVDIDRTTSRVAGPRGSWQARIFRAGPWNTMVAHCCTPDRGRREAFFKTLKSQ